MESAFETGASTKQANDLVLSVLNDGAVYSDRKHIGFAMLQGAQHRNMKFIDLVRGEAAKQRKSFGSKFSAAHLSEAAKLVQSATIQHCLETIREEWNGEKIDCERRRWRDNINGNSYFSAWIVIPTNTAVRWIGVPFQYGYGNHWEWVCLHTLIAIGIFEDKGRTSYLSDYPLSFHDQGMFRKNQMFGGLHFVRM